ncbi:MAG TPA: DUF4233 domain-containing protein [Motilibacteraceae bacterium]|nr:DUF4233 domain-containing protein [Motilibacteraceae bacterium]
MSEPAAPQPGQQPGQQQAQPRPFRTRRTLCAGVLGVEALISLFATLVAKDLSDVSTGTVLGVGLGAAVLCLLLAGLLRHGWAYPAGSVLQVLLVLSGFVVTAMFFVGGVFAVLWFVSLHLARKVERLDAQRAAAGS